MSAARLIFPFKVKKALFAAPLVTRSTQKTPPQQQQGGVRSMVSLSSGNQEPSPFQQLLGSSESEETHTDLHKKKCVPCESTDLRAMSADAAMELLQKVRQLGLDPSPRATLFFLQVPGWALQHEDGKLCLQRTWKAKSFVRGLEFFNLVADVAEAEGHHPDLHLVGYNNVTVNISTHAVGGLTENDFILAAKIGALDVSSLFRKPKV